METPWMVGCVTKLALESEGHLDIFISNGKVRVPKSGSKPHLPLDICSEILCRLPVKSLLRFRCVSKSWRSLIDDPQFCYLHFNAFKNNSHETHLFIIQRNQSFSLSSLIVCRQTLEKTKLVPVLAGMDTEIPEKWIVQFLVDGLVLLSKRGHETMLWNPSIRRCRRVSYMGLDAFADIGIGFDPLTKDYKYVKAFSRHCRQRVAIYSVRSNSWKTCRATGDDARWSLVSDKPIDFRGSLYTTRKDMLMSFCLSTKVFTRTNLPMYDKRQYCLDLAIVDGGSSLAVIGRPWDGLGYCMIWALETNVSTNGAVSMCWSKRYAFTMDFVELFFFPKSKGDALFQRRYLGRYGDRRKCKLDLVSYNMETQEERILQRSSSQSTSYVTVYKESLVLLN